jgi:hypothetical protein
MGITDNVFMLHCKSYLDNAKSIVELGSQHYIAAGRIVGYFSNIFKWYNILSIDLNGENGSLKVDLTKSISLDKPCDLITNFGTSEHVSNQYMCWKNIHSMLSEDGIVISEIPEIGSWKGHCKYYVDYQFFNAMYRDFEIIDYRSIFFPDNGYNTFSILKKKSAVFETPIEEFNKFIKIDETVRDHISF